MTALQIFVLGTMHARHVEQERPVPLSRANQKLLGYLSLFGFRESVPREAIAEALWPECAPKQSRNRLSTALWRLRRALGPALSACICDGGETVSLEEAWVDAHVLSEDIHALRHAPPDALTREGTEALDATLQLYRNPLMTGHDLPWIVAERQRLSDDFCYGLERLLKFFRASGQQDRSIEAGHEILRHDPLREDIHEALISLYGECGQRRRALNQFDQCRTMLRTELGLEPSDTARRALARTAAEAIEPHEIRALMADISTCMDQLNAKLDRLRNIVGET